MTDLEYLKETFLMDKEIWKRDLEMRAHFDPTNLDYIEGKIDAISYVIKLLERLEGK